MSARIKNQFEPNYTVPPGDTLEEWLEEQAMKKSELAERIGRPVQFVSELLSGKRMLTPQTALELEAVTGIEAAFWNEVESAYRTALQRQHRAEEDQQRATWARSFSYREFAKAGWVPATRDPLQKATFLSRFLAVVPNQWERVFKPMLGEGAYRISKKVNSQPTDLSMWIQMGTKIALQQETPEFSKKRFKQAIEETRKLARVHPAEALPAICDAYADAGVSLVVLPALGKNATSGYARWLSKAGKFLIMLSLRGKSDDLFWFDLFHETAHVLLHGKKKAFLDFGQDRHDTPEEKDADDWAANLLVPERDWKAFRKAHRQPDREPVLQFAEQHDVSPGVIVAWLHREKAYTWPDGKKAVYAVHSDLKVSLTDHAERMWNLPVPMDLPQRRALRPELLASVKEKIPAGKPAWDRDEFYENLSEKDYAGLRD